MKLKYLISIHSRIDFLNFTLNHYLNVFNVDPKDIIISTSNKELNFEKKDIITNLLIHDIDYGYSGGCQYNIIKGIEYIKNNFEFDYIICIEPDNIFYDKGKLFDLINDMNDNNKHFLVDQQIIKSDPVNFGTINIFSKHFIDNYFPFEIYEDFFRIAYEDYMGQAIFKKNFENELTRQQKIDFYLDKGLLLEYSYENHFKEDPEPYHAGRFVKYGIINAFDNNYNNFLNFLERDRRKVVKIFITGQKGYIGSKLFEYYSNLENYKVYTSGDVDLTNTEEVNKIFNETFSIDDIDLVLHCASRGGRLNNMTENVLQNNISIFENLVRNKKYYKFFISFGSGAEFNRNENIENVNDEMLPLITPTDSYGLSKYIINQRIKQLDKFLNLRLFNCFGPNDKTDRFIPTIFKKYSDKQPMIVFDNAKVDFFSIFDLIKVVEYCLNNKETISFKSLNLCYDNKFLLNQICEFINSLGDFKSEIEINNLNFKSYCGESKLKDLPDLKLLGFENSIKKIAEEDYNIGLKKLFWVETKYPIAFMSPDHIVPHGTSRDNHGKAELIQEFEDHFGRKIKFMDLGCSGGKFVKEAKDMGNYSIGLEGSDYSVLNKRAEWPELYKKNLFTCDISKPYNIYLYDSSSIDHVKFDVISAWEVIEHIHPDDLDTFFLNIKNHLAPNGFFIGSISPNEEIIQGVALHQSVFPADKWRNEILTKYFDVFDYPFKNRLRDEQQSLTIQLKHKK